MAGRAEIPVEQYLLQRAVIARARSEQQLLDAVATARANGLLWHTIGAIIGTSAQAAHQRYGALVEGSDEREHGSRQRPSLP